MKIWDIFEGVGRITPQNQTVDVGPNQVSIEAAKFGFKVDKDGRPAHTARGSSVHKLFNLGLTESVLVKLERDKRNNIYVLHMVDNEDKHRVELRGEKGYETGNYNKNDRLHQVLDGLGKAVDLGALFAGETVSINPHHPDGEQALNITKAVMTNEQKGPCPVTGEAVCKCNDKKLNEAGSVIGRIVQKLGFGKEAVNSVFRILRRRKGNSGLSDDKVRAMAYRAVQREREELENVKAATIKKQPFKYDQKMDELPGQRWDDELGMYVIDEVAPPGREDQVLALKGKVDNPYAVAWASYNKSKKKESVDENFADGKKKGKSRPGRVKRSGASCKGSVTSLRKKAKKYKGERGKMYHWCANMKSGRRKKS